MAIAFRAGSTATAAATSSLSAPWPTGIQPGDVVLASVQMGYASSETRSIQVPTGWAQIVSHGLGTAGDVGEGDFKAFYTIYQTGDAAPVFTVNGGNASVLTCSLAAYSGVDLVNPLQIGSGTFTGVNATTHAAPDIVTAVNSSYVVRLFGGLNHTSTSSWSYTTPTSHTSRANAGAAASGATRYARTAIFDEIQSTAGSAGTASSTSSVGTYTIAATMALRPAPRTYHAYEIAVLADSPVGYYQMNDAVGSTVADCSTSYNADGTYVNSPTLGVSGAIPGNNAVYFDGSQHEHITVPDPSNWWMDVGDSFSLGLLYKPAITGAKQPFMYKGTNSYYFYIDTDNKVKLAQAGGPNIVESSITLTNTNKWYHIVVTKSGSTTKLYIDGVDRTVALTNATLSNTDNPLMIASDGLGYSLTGTLDEVVFFFGALSANSVQLQYNSLGMDSIMYGATTSGAGTSSGVPQSSVEITTPAVGQGDCMVLAMNFNDPVNVVLPAGWKALNRHVPAGKSGSGGAYPLVFYKIAGASEPATFTATFRLFVNGTWQSANRYVAWVCTSYYNVHQTKPINVWAATTNNGSSTATSIPFSDITTKSNGAQIIRVAGGKIHSANTFEFIAPPGHTERGEAGHMEVSAYNRVAFYDINAGFSNSVSGASNASCNYATITFALNPVGGADPGPEPPALRSAITDAGTGTTSALSYNLSMPYEYQPGDLLLYLAYSSGGTGGTPTGFTRLTSIETSGMNLLVYYKWADGSEGSEVAVAYSAAGIAFGVVMSFAGVDQSNPFNTRAEVADGGPTTTATTSWYSPGVSPGIANTYLVRSVCWGGTTTLSSTLAVSPPTNYIEIAEAMQSAGLTNAANRVIEVAGRIMPDANPTPSNTNHVSNHATTTWDAATIALAPSVFEYRDQVSSAEIITNATLAAVKKQVFSRSGTAEITTEALMYRLRKSIYPRALGTSIEPTPSLRARQTDIIRSASVETAARMDRNKIAAPLTWYLRPSTLAAGSNHGSLATSAPTNAQTTTGWNMGNVAAARFARMDTGTVRAVGAMTSTAQPNGPPDNTLGDSFRSGLLKGLFTDGTWTMRFRIICSRSSAIDARLNVRLWRSPNADGSSATEITSGVSLTSVASNITTTSQEMLLSANFNRIVLSNEYLFIQVALETTGASTNVNDILYLYEGSSASITTPSFYTGVSAVDMNVPVPLVSALSRDRTVGMTASVNTHGVTVPSTILEPLVAEVNASARLSTVRPKRLTAEITPTAGPMTRDTAQNQVTLSASVQATAPAFATRHAWSFPAADAFAEAFITRVVKKNLFATSTTQGRSVKLIGKAPLVGNIFPEAERPMMMQLRTLRAEVLTSAAMQRFIYKYVRTESRPTPLILAPGSIAEDQFYLNLGAYLQGARGSIEPRVALYISNKYGDEITRIDRGETMMLSMNNYRDHTWELDIHLPANDLVDPLTDYFKPVIDIWTGNRWHRWPLGLYRAVVPDSSIFEGLEVWDFTARSLESVVSEDMAEIGYGVHPNQPILATVKDILQTYFGVPDTMIDFPATDALMRGHLVFDIASDPSSCYWLNIINTMLAAGAFVPLQTDAAGRFITRPFQGPDQRQPTVFYGDHGGFGDKIVDALEAVEVARDASEFANRILVTANDPLLPAIVAISANMNPHSPYSILNLNKRVTKTIELPQLVGASEAKKIADAELARRSGIFERITYRTPFDPRRSPGEVASLNLTHPDGSDAVTGKWIYEGWTADLAPNPGYMQHTLSRLSDI